MEKIDLETIEQNPQLEEEQIEYKKENNTNREILEHNEYPFFRYEKKLQKVPKHRQIEWEKENLVFDAYYSYEIDWNSIDWKKNAEMIIENGEFFDKWSEDYRQQVRKKIANINFSDLKDIQDNYLTDSFKEGKREKTRDKDVYNIKQLIITDIIRIISEYRTPDYTFNHVFSWNDDRIIKSDNNYKDFSKKLLSQKLFNIEDTYESCDEMYKSGKNPTMDDFIDTNFTRCFDGGELKAKIISFNDEHNDYMEKAFDYRDFLAFIYFFEQNDRLPSIESSELESFIINNFLPDHKNKYHADEGTYLRNTYYAAKKILEQKISNEPWEKYRLIVKNVMDEMKNKQYIIYRPFSLMGRLRFDDENTKSYYSAWGQTFSEKKITFCFGEQNKLFKQYIEKINDLSKNNCFDFKETLELNYFSNQVNISYDWDKPGNKHSFNRPNNITSEYLGKQLQEDNSNHPFMYWLINHPDFIQPSWCFAEWAVIPTEKKLRILQPIIDEIEKQDKKEELES